MIRKIVTLINVNSHRTFHVFFVWLLNRSHFFVSLDQSRILRIISLRKTKPVTDTHRPPSYSDPRFSGRSNDDERLHSQWQSTGILYLTARS
jgi:hypothetical protein